jgi:16S rRNA processing protein RimM
LTSRFAAALVGAPFGITGRVKIQSLSGETEHLLALKTVVLRKDGRETSCEVEESSLVPLTMKFAGIESPEAAKTLKGAEILVDRSRAAPLAEGEFYIEDLKGLKVFLRETPEADKNSDQINDSPRLEGRGMDPPANQTNETAKPVGEITGIMEGGGGFLAEITLPTGEKKLVPFRDEFFGGIDPEQGRAELIRGWILEEL